MEKRKENHITYTIVLNQDRDPFVKNLQEALVESQKLQQHIDQMDSARKILTEIINPQPQTYSASY
ncbi:MAG: hypothetical protein ABIN58_04060 [candidate division WOR-3 bacterium]